MHSTIYRRTCERKEVSPSKNGIPAGFPGSYIGYLLPVFIGILLVCGAVLLGVVACKNAIVRLGGMQVNRRVEVTPEQMKEGVPQEVIVDVPGPRGVVGDPNRGGNVRVDKNAHIYANTHVNKNTHLDTNMCIDMKDSPPSRTHIPTNEDTPKGTYTDMENTYTDTKDTYMDTDTHTWTRGKAQLTARA